MSKTVKKTLSFEEMLLKPVPQTAAEKRMLGIGLYTHWQPFAAALRAEGTLSEQDMPAGDLGAPERYNGLRDDGTIKRKTAGGFSRLQKRITTNLQNFMDDKVSANANTSAYKKVVMDAEQAAAPLRAADKARMEKDFTVFELIQDALNPTPAAAAVPTVMQEAENIAAAADVPAPTA